MADDDIGKPLWWVGRLEQALLNRRSQMQLMDDYYRGAHPLPFVTRAHNAKMRDEFRGLLEDARSNFMRLVVDTVEERLSVVGFRLSASSDQAADKRSWDIWQANAMDAESSSAFTEALVKGVSYLSVWREPGDEYPTMAVEDPIQTIVAYAAGSNFRRRDAALKMWADEWTGDLRANLYLPHGIYKYVRPGVADTSLTAGTSAGMLRGQLPPWEMLGDPDGFVSNPLGVVPIIPLRNRARLLVEGESELVDITDSQDRINGTLFLRCLAGYFGAHRQRWAVGLRMMEDDEGNPVEPFDVAVDKLWQTEDPEVHFGEFSQTDLGGYIKSIDQDVQHVAVVSRTPRHYLMPEGQEPSGDSLNGAEAGLIKKAQRKQRPFGEGLEEGMRLARRFAGETDAPVDSEIVWADPRTLSEAEITDAVIKQFQANLIPWEAALEKLGYTQTQIARFQPMRQQDAMLAALSAPTIVAGNGAVTLPPGRGPEQAPPEPAPNGPAR